jgi:starch phosphorylase
VVKGTLFANFHRLWPSKITNVTNGVTPRRWLCQANPLLVSLISKLLAPARSIEP